jgi:hypothetical protein
MAATQKHRMHGNVLLVGSMPFETVEDALRSGAALGTDVTCLPDGEVGDRQFWVTFLPTRTYSRHPDLFESRSPDDGFDHQPDHDTTTMRPGAAREFHWTYQVKDGVDALAFDSLGYADIAKESYATFRRLRDEGVIAPGVRFQVSLPATSSGVDQFFDDPKQWPMVHAAYARAMRAEIAQMVLDIPPDDLAVQFDLAWEVVDLSIGDERYFPFWPQATFAQKFARHTDLLVDLCVQIPEEVLLGFHWCYGTWGGWPMTEMADLRLCVDLSNDTVPRAGRRVDYVHMPVPVDPGPGFFAPLRDLDIGDTRVYLGLVHHEDGIEGCRGRIALASEVLDDFGVAAVCGYGREDRSQVAGVLDLHRACAAELSDVPPS